MPNYCYYQMKVKGNNENINEFISMMNYTHPQKQFYRVFAADVYESGDGYFCISGDVAWSVYCAFLQISCKCERTDKEFTLISDVSKELQLEIEIYSSEPGMCFQEHFCSIKVKPFITNVLIILNTGMMIWLMKVKQTKENSQHFWRTPD